MEGDADSHMKGVCVCVWKGGGAFCSLFQTDSESH